MQHRAGAGAAELVSVKDDVNRPCFQQIGQVVPQAARELRLDSELARECASQVDFETDDLARLIGVRIDIRSAPFLVAAPDERAAGANVVERIGATAAAETA